MQTQIGLLESSKPFENTRAAAPILRSLSLARMKLWIFVMAIVGTLSPPCLRLWWHIVPSSPCDDEGESSESWQDVFPGRLLVTRSAVWTADTVSRKTLIIIITHSALILIDRHLYRTLSTLSCQDTQINGKGLHRYLVNIWNIQTHADTLYSELNGSILQYSASFVSGLCCNLMPRSGLAFRGETQQLGYFFLFFISSRANRGPSGSKYVMDLIKMGGVHFVSASVSVLMATYNGSENRQLVFVPSAARPCDPGTR